MTNQIIGVPSKIAYMIQKVIDAAAHLEKSRQDVKCAEHDLSSMREQLNTEVLKELVSNHDSS